MKDLWRSIGNAIVQRRLARADGDNVIASLRPRPRQPTDSRGVVLELGRPDAVVLRFPPSLPREG